MQGQTIFDIWMLQHQDMVQAAAHAFSDRVMFKFSFEFLITFKVVLYFNNFYVKLSMNKPRREALAIPLLRVDIVFLLKLENTSVRIFFSISNEYFSIVDQKLTPH